MAHTFRPDPGYPQACDTCGMPEVNRQHANPEAVVAAVAVLESRAVAESLDAAETSLSAAREASVQVGKGARRTVLAAVIAAGQRGITDKEIEALPDITWGSSTTRPRRVELHKGGLIAERRDGKGAVVQRENAQVWVATDAGRAAFYGTQEQLTA